MNNMGLSTYERISRMIDSTDQLTEQQRIDLRVKQFYKLTKWSNENYEAYDILLKELKRIRRQKEPSTSELGKALENIVDFIFNKSFVYKVYSNKRSSTHEIDQFVVLTDNGKQAMADLKITDGILPTGQNYFLCECKNYKKTVGTTWVGKFNTLMEVSGKCELGIIFSCEGLTGKEQNWENSHGLTKVIHYLSGANSKRFILDFNLDDLDLISKDRTINIFDIIKNKKHALQSCINSHKLLEEKHDGYEDIEVIFNEFNQIN